MREDGLEYNESNWMLLLNDLVNDNGNKNVC